MDRSRLASVVAQHAEYAQACAFGPTDRRAHVERVECAEFVKVALDQVGQFQQDLLAFIRLELAPWPFNRRARGRDSTIDVLCVTFCNGCQQLAGRWIAAREGLPGNGLNPFAVDQHLLDGSVRIRMTGQWDRVGYSHVRSP